MKRSAASRRFLFEFCVHGEPVSAQTNRSGALQAWKRNVSAKCRTVWAEGRERFEGDLIVRVTFYREDGIGDMDNLVKPVLDALQGIVHLNDRQISDVVANRRDINGHFRVRYMSRPLAEAFSHGEQFVHIRIDKAPKRRDLG